MSYDSRCACKRRRASKNAIPFLGLENVLFKTDEKTNTVRAYGLRQELLRDELLSYTKVHSVKIKR